MGVCCGGSRRTCCEVIFYCQTGPTPANVLHSRPSVLSSFLSELFSVYALLAYYGGVVHSVSLKGSHECTDVLLHLIPFVRSDWPNNRRRSMIAWRADVWHTKPAKPYQEATCAVLSLNTHKPGWTPRYRQRRPSRILRYRYYLLFT